MATGRGPVANYDRGQGIEKLGVFERKQAIRILNLNASANVTYNEVLTTADCVTANIAADRKEMELMPDYTLGKVEILLLALAKTDAGVVLSGSADWIEPRKFDCPNCGETGADGVRQAERDEVCLYVCRQCDAIVNERLPF